MITKKEMMINSLMTNENASREDYKSIIFVTYTKNNQNIMAMWKHKGHKPMFHYAYKTIEAMNEAINNQKAYEDSEDISRQEQSKRYESIKDEIKEGSILYSSWGYEQTNIDYYKVLSRKNDLVVIVQIGAKDVEYDGHHMTGRSIADDSVIIGEPMRKKITKYGSVSLESYKFTTLWDGQPKSYSCYA